MDKKYYLALDRLLAKNRKVYQNAASTAKARNAKQRSRYDIHEFLYKTQATHVAKAVLNVIHARVPRENADELSQLQRRQFHQQAQTINNLATQLHAAELVAESKARLSFMDVVNGNNETLKNAAMQMAMQWLLETIKQHERNK